MMKIVWLLYQSIVPIQQSQTTCYVYEAQICELKELYIGKSFNKTLTNKLLFW